MTNVAIGNGPVEIVDLPINSMVMFHSYLYVYQRVDYRLVTVESAGFRPLVTI